MIKLSVDAPNGISTFGIRQSDNRNALVLTGAAKSITVPAEANKVVFSSTDDFWMNLSGVAAIPGADVTNGTASELNPVVRSVVPGQTISVIGNCTVNINFYK